MKDNAEQHVKTNLILTTIARAKKIETTNKDIDKELKKTSERSNISAEGIKNTLGDTDIIKNNTRIQKVTDLLRDSVKLVEGTKEG